MTEEHRRLPEGVAIPDPGAVRIGPEVDPARIEPGVVIHPGCRITGGKTLLRAGTVLGAGGGGLFENVRTGRNVRLDGGVFRDCVLLDGASVRSNAEIRGGTLLEEEASAAHTVGLKMTIFLPFVVTGSLVNFCDALVAGGTSRSDHSEIGSLTALYNFTPWGDKFASLFGDVPRGVFLRSPRIFVGGQTKIVSPVRVGYGSVVAAGSPVRGSVPEGVLYSEPHLMFRMEFDPRRLGSVDAKFRVTIEYVANLRALELWYRTARAAFAEAASDRLQEALYESALEQIRALIYERIPRTYLFSERLPVSIEWRRSDPPSAERDERIREQEAWRDAWPRIRSRLTRPAEPGEDGERFLERFRERLGRDGGDCGWPEFVRDRLPAEDAAAGTAWLRRIVREYSEGAPGKPERSC